MSLGRAGALVLALLITACTAPTPVATPVPSRGGVLLHETGSGQRNTAVFEAPAMYAVDYSFDCQSAGFRFINIQAVAAGPKYEELLVGSTRGTDHGTTYGHRAGPTYLDVTLQPCTWEITVRLP